MKFLNFFKLLQNNQKVLKYNNLYMDIAKRCAKMSHAKRRQVGAIIVKNGQIISMGWNGTPRNFDNTCEENGITKEIVLHAESNAITKLTKSTETGDGSTLYITLSPCIHCAKLIIQSGISEVIYLEKYKDSSGIELIKQSNINIKELK